MVSLDIVRSTNATIVQSQPLVAVVVGGTSGIGEHTIYALAAANAAHQGRGFRLYFVGRREASGKRVTDEVLRVYPSAEVSFMKADVSLLKEVDRVSEEVKRSEEARVSKSGGEARIDLLIMCQGVVYFDGRRGGSEVSKEWLKSRKPTTDDVLESPEGLDIFMSLIYYSRIRFTLKLLPLLQASKCPAHVISVFGPNRGEKLYKDDLSLRSPKHYGFMLAGSHSAYMKTLVFEHLAKIYPTISFSHYFPGLVITEAFHDPSHPVWLRVSQRMLKPVLRWVTTSQTEAGERVLFMASDRFPARVQVGREEKATNSGLEVAVASDGRSGGGAYRVNADGRTLPPKKEYAGMREEGLEQTFWDHTMKAFEEIEAGGKFSG